MKVFAIITAGGSGTRMKAGVRKQYIEIKNRPILAHTLNKFCVTSEIDSIILTVPQEDIETVKKSIVDKYELSKIITILPGGEQRQDSVFNALKNMNAEGDDIVLIHDGVRPFISHEIIVNCIRSLEDSDGSVVGIRPFDTIKTVSAGSIKNTLNREELISVQTPQTFRYGTIVKCHELAASEGFYATDDSALVERYGERVLGKEPSIKIVEGNSFNIKITDQNDLILASALLEQLTV
ncbi:MAG: 2-C-methyl-D-erythritol 4-phosphate cytidylyltransferase [Candidatus Delongbacteria bacterium]|nr:2-C-methyl-D-erythritol 4-phosphate cytidylyltransferase [Candidatus Delongbacteria bacterium]